MVLFSFSSKAIEEIDISDKAVAAAVNEAIECNTNVSVLFFHEICNIDSHSNRQTINFFFFFQEIIADAHHQNNINE